MLRTIFKGVIFTGYMLYGCYAGAQLKKEDSATLAYIEKYKDLAMSEMRRTGMPAAIKIAQGLVETQSGMGDLVLRSKNHFGLKCKRSWTGERVFHDDDAIGECFRKYATDSLSYIDQSDYLKNSKRYHSLFASEDPLDYKAWAQGLKKAGYATNPRYVTMLISKIEDWGLQKYSLMAWRASGKINDKAYHQLLSGVSFRKEKEVNAAIALWASKAAAASLDGQSELDDEDNIRWNMYRLAFTVTIEKEYASIAEEESSPSSAAASDRSVKEQTDVFLSKLKLKRINKRRVVRVPKGMSLLAIAMYYDVPYASILLYNDFPSDANVTLQHQYVFLDPKRDKAHKQVYHIVQKGQTLYDIAQAYGVYLHKIREYNYLAPGMEPRPDAKVYLRGNAPLRPAIY